VKNMTIARQRFGKDGLKAGIVESRRTSTAEQRFGNHIPAATNSHIRTSNDSVSTVSVTTE
jgi:hypothetical protein